MKTPATTKDHPWHPILVALPIGLWLFSLFCDIMAYWHLGNADWKSVAYFSMAGGIITALVAAIPGLIDLVSIHDLKLKRIGVTHMSMNLVIVAAYAANFFLRRTGAVSYTVCFILSILSVIALAISGWLGAELVHRYGVTIASNPESRTAAV